MGIEITVNLNNLNYMKKVIDYLTSHRLVIGFVGDETNEEGIKISEYAYYVEYGKGKGNVPRPFLRNANPEVQKMVNSKLKKITLTCVNSKLPAETILNTLGTEAVGLIQESIQNGSYAGNKPGTLKQKKGNKPLIDTGTMMLS